MTQMPLAAVDTLAVVAIAGVILGPLVTYLIAARRFSGKIGSSDAAQLWEESRSIRDWSSNQIAKLTATIASLETRVESVETQNSGLATVNSDLTQQVRDLSDTITQLRAEIVDLTSELRRAHERVQELEDDVEEAEGG